VQYQFSKSVFVRSAFVHKLRVLIADDHEAMRRLLVTILGVQFTVVSAVPDGKSLVEAALALAPDVIVSDVSMPQMNGLQSMKELRAKGHDIPFVLVSIDSRGSEEFIRQGAAAFVDKMDIQDELLFAVRSVSENMASLSQIADRQVKAA
jgi:two-component system response regulator NreC